MLPEQESLIYKHFVDLVKECDLERIMRSLSLEDPAAIKIMDNVKIEDDRRHNNRCILFQIINTNSATLFCSLVKGLRVHMYEDLADKLENKPTVCRPKYGNPSDALYAEHLKVSVKHATKFCDIDEFCYKTRSKNRGKVLVVNNVVFDAGKYKTRRGAEVDENNLKQLFEQSGLSVETYRNLSADELKTVVTKFTMREYGISPDMGIVIIMSHGDKVDNKTVIIGSDGKGVEEDWIIRQFNNQACSLFKHKPKILIFNICRGDSVDNLRHFAQHTQSDTVLTRKPDIDEDERYYSDLIICHPSVEGFQAHRDTLKGCWYIELICMTFMENSHQVDVESMLKMVERGLKTRISEKMTRQTSTFLNISFKTCFLNPGIYEEEGMMVQFKQPL